MRRQCQSVMFLVLKGISPLRHAERQQQQHNNKRNACAAINVCAAMPYNKQDTPSNRQHTDTPRKPRQSSPQHRDAEKLLHRVTHTNMVHDKDIMMLHHLSTAPLWYRQTGRHTDKQDSSGKPLPTPNQQQTNHAASRLRKELLIQQPLRSLLLRVCLIELHGNRHHLLVDCHCRHRRCSSCCKPLVGLGDALVELELGADVGPHVIDVHQGLQEGQQRQQLAV